MRAILTYHSIDPSGSVISVDPDVFVRQMEWLAKSDVRVMSLADLATGPDDGYRVALTFDDGFTNFAQVAAPALRALGLPATVFVVSDRPGSTNRWGRKGGDRGIPELPLLDWDALAALARDGFDLGGHTRSHPRLDRIAPSRLADEIVGSSEAIRTRIGYAPTTFAYPYGATTPAAVAAVRTVYRFACTTELRMIRATDDSHLLPRVDMYYFRRQTSLDVFVAPVFPYRLGLRSLARRVRGGVLSLAGAS